MCRKTCKIPETVDPTKVKLETTVKFWSDKKTWTDANLEVPKDGSNVTIPTTWLLSVAVDTPKLTTLEVRGTLIVD